MYVQFLLTLFTYSTCSPFPHSPLSLTQRGPFVDPQSVSMVTVMEITVSVTTISLETIVTDPLMLQQPPQMVPPTAVEPIATMEALVMVFTTVYVPMVTKVMTVV